MLGVVPCIVSPQFKTRSSRGVETCGGRSKVQDAGVWTAGRDSAFEGRRLGFFLQKSNFNLQKLARPKLQNARIQHAWQQDGELDMHTKPEIR